MSTATGHRRLDSMTPQALALCPAQVGARVQTQFAIEEGGDDEWYAGTVSALHPGSQVSVVYDDGDSWTGDAREIYMLRGPDDGGVPQGVPQSSVQMAVGYPVAAPAVAVGTVGVANRWRRD